MSEISIKRGILYEIEKVWGVFAASALAVGLLAACGAGDKAEEGSTGGLRMAIRLKSGSTLNCQVMLLLMVLQKLSGIELAVEEINAAGGIDGKEIELVKVDNKSDACRSNECSN